MFHVPLCTSLQVQLLQPGGGQAALLAVTVLWEATVAGEAPYLHTWCKCCSLISAGRFSNRAPHWPRMEGLFMPTSEPHSQGKQGARIIQSFTDERQYRLMCVRANTFNSYFLGRHAVDTFREEINGEII